MIGDFGLNIAIRLDASFEIGSGHLMRCLTLADTFRKSGIYTRFICRHLPTNLHELLSRNGHDVVLLTGKDKSVLKSELEHAEWLGVNQEFDAAETLNAIPDKQWDWIIVDNYALDYRWEGIVKNTVAKILVIDDLSDRRHICDIFLNQNIVDDAETLYADKLPKEAVKLIGPQYALLRDEFLEARSKATFRTGPIKNVLVSFGGADVDNVTGKVLEALSLNKQPQLNINVVIGAEHPYRRAIQDACNAEGYNCYIQTNKMAELMLEADLAIGAAGSTSWERCCLALPSIAIPVAEHQTPIAQVLGELGAVICLGSGATVTDELISKAFNKLCNSCGSLLKMSEMAYDIVDGIGKERVLKNMGI